MQLEQQTRQGLRACSHRAFSDNSECHRNKDGVPAPGCRRIPTCRRRPAAPTLRRSDDRAHVSAMTACLLPPAQAPHADLASQCQTMHCAPRVYTVLPPLFVLGRHRQTACSARPRRRPSGGGRLPRRGPGFHAPSSICGKSLRACAERETRGIVRYFAISSPPGENR